MTALEFLGIFVGVSAGLAAAMTGAWLIWRATQNSGWIDTTWTFGLGAVGCLGALTPFLRDGALAARQVLVVLLVIVWALRLGIHIARRTSGITDDPRYARLVKDWGDGANRQMFFLAQKQALVSIPLALSIVLAAWNPLPGMRAQDFLGALVLVDRHCRRGGRGCAVAALSRRPVQPRPDLRHRSVGLVAASELFFRMVRLARLSAARD